MFLFRYVYKIAGYKIHTKKLSTNDRLGKKSGKYSTFHNSLRKVKISCEIKPLRHLRKKLKILEVLPCYWIGRINTVTMTILPEEEPAS